MTEIEKEETKNTFEIANIIKQSNISLGDTPVYAIADLLSNADYRKQSETVNEFANKVLKDIGDAIDHNTRLMESSHNTNLATYHNALITNNVCKGIYDMIQKIVAEFGKGSEWK